jgi:hypothetical protein
MSKRLKYWSSKLLRKKVICETLNFSELNFVEAISAIVVDRQEATMFGDMSVDFQGFPKTSFPSTGVFMLENALINSNSGWVFSRDNKLLVESTWYAGYHEELQGQKSKQAIFPQYFKGTLLSLISDFSVNNYGHKLYDSFGRYYLFLKAGYTAEDYDNILIPGKESSRWRSVAQKLGIPGHKIIWADEIDFLRVDRLMVASYPGVRRNYPPWLTSYLKETLVVPVTSRDRKLYVRRVGRRRVANEEALIPILEEAGFEIYLPENSENSFQDFAEAKAIIGPHGAGLNDIAFCNRETQLLELMPSDHQYEYFYTIADSAGLDYACLLGDSEEIRSSGSKGPSSANFYIDSIIFKETIDTFFNF